MRVPAGTCSDNDEAELLNEGKAMNLVPLMNNTKWDEVRLAMYALGDDSPYWRTRDVENGYICPWDRDWYYHFRVGGYWTSEWVEIRIDREPQRDRALRALRKIHVPGEPTNNGFIVYGYASPGQFVDYL